MKALSLRSVAVLLLSAALFGLLASKAAFTLLGSTKAHELAMQRRSIRATSNRLSKRQLAHEVKQLLEALTWMPNDADLWYQLGRNLHLIAGGDVSLSPYVRERLVAGLDLSAESSTAPHRELSLQAAIVSYDRAIAANHLVSGVRIWKVAAQVALDPPDAQTWQTQTKPALALAAAFDPEDPGLWRAAGDLALNQNDTEMAVRCYRQSLRWKLDGVAVVAERLLDHPDGAALLDDAIPKNAVARRKLADYLLDQWRFDAAREAFAQALRLEGRAPSLPPAGEVISDGDFTADPALLLRPWEVVEVPGVDILHDRNDEGGVLRVAFKRGPGNWYHVKQEVPVEPGGRYRLAALVSVDGFVASETFGVEAVHPYEATLFAADARCRVSGRHDLWPASNGEFVTVTTELTVPPGLRMLSVRLRRFGGDARDAGHVSFTNVSLVRLPEPEEKTVDEN